MSATQRDRKLVNETVSLQMEINKVKKGMKELQSMSDIVSPYREEINSFSPFFS